MRVPLIGRLLAPLRPLAGSLAEPSRTTPDRLPALLAASTGHLIVATDLTGVVTLVNAGAERLLGRSAADLVGHPIPADVLDADEIAAWSAQAGGLAAALVRAAGDGGHETRDWTVVHRDGDRRIVSLTVSPLSGADGEPTGFLGIGTDVTDARRTVDALANQDAIHRTLIAHLPRTFVGLLRPDLTWLTVGGEITGPSGVTIDGLVGTTVAALLPPDEAASVQEWFRRAQGRPGHREFDLGDGRAIVVDALPVAGPDGGPLTLVVSRDVTAERSAAREKLDMLAALGVSEQTFRTAFEQAPIGIALTSPDRGTAARFLRVNPAFARILGREPADLAGQPIVQFTHPDDRAVCEATDITATTGPVQKRYLHASGRAVWTEVFFALVRDQNGEPSHHVVHIDDITARKSSELALLDAYEQEQIAARALADLERLRSDAMANLSHELRTPLTSINGYLEVLTDGDAGPLNGDQADMLRIVVRNANRLTTLVEDLLVLTRLDETAMPFPERMTTVDLGLVVKASVEAIRPLIASRGQRLDLDAPPSLPWVTGDPDQLDRALINVLTNASLFTADGGWIGLSAAVSGRTVAITVTDTGIGIPLDEQARIGERFFRASNAQANLVPGSGLGLAITTSILDRHHGDLTIESTPGSGSTFTLTLPVTAA